MQLLHHYRCKKFHNLFCGTFFVCFYLCHFEFDSLKAHIIGFHRSL
jgi:hypothetical protein